MVVMAKFKIRLNTAKETALFVNVCMHYDCPIDCLVDRIIVDGKSIMGMVNFIGKIVRKSRSRKIDFLNFFKNK